MLVRQSGQSRHEACDKHVDMLAVQRALQRRRIGLAEGEGNRPALAFGDAGRHRAGAGIGNDDALGIERNLAGELVHIGPVQRHEQVEAVGLARHRRGGDLHQRRRLPPRTWAPNSLLIMP